jgi:hypothetical protein
MPTTRTRPIRHSVKTHKRNYRIIQSFKRGSRVPKLIVKPQTNMLKKPKAKKVIPTEIHFHSIGGKGYIGVAGKGIEYIIDSDGTDRSDIFARVYSPLTRMDETGSIVEGRGFFFSKRDGGVLKIRDEGPIVDGHRVDYPNGREWLIHLKQTTTHKRKIGDRVFGGYKNEMKLTTNNLMSILIHEVLIPLKTAGQLHFINENFVIDDGAKITKIIPNEKTPLYTLPNVKRERAPEEIDVDGKKYTIVEDDRIPRTKKVANEITRDKGWKSIKYHIKEIDGMYYPYMYINNDDFSKELDESIKKNDAIRKEYAERIKK